MALIHWWIHQLASMIPAGWIRALDTEPDGIVLAADGAQASLFLRRRGVSAPLARARSDEAGFAELARAARKRRGVPSRLVLRLPAGSALTKTISLPAAARRHARAVLRFEIDRETPFSAEEVYWDFRIQGHGAARDQIAVELAVVPRALADPLLRAAREAGLQPTGFEGTTSGGDPVAIALEDGGMLRGGGSRRAVAALATAAAVLAVAAVGIPFLKQEWRIAATEARLAAHEGPAREAAELRRNVDALAGAAALLARERALAGWALGALAAATEAVPDDTYLTALSARDGKFTLTGLSRSAAGLVSALAESSAFADPAFAAPVVRAESSGLETFAVSVALKREAGP